MTDGNNCAFAHPGIMGNHAESGLTKREYFAAMAMQGLLANSGNGGDLSVADSRLLSMNACRMADYLIDDLNYDEKRAAGEI